MDKIIEFAELGEYIDEPIKTYSTGMRARLGFGLNLELSPDLLLIDEVLGVGDVNMKKKAMAAMKDKISSDQTVVYVSHDLQSVAALCDRAVWIENGVTRSIGSPKEIVREYKNVTK